MEFIFIAKVIAFINGTISLIKELCKFITFGRSALNKEKAVEPSSVSDSVSTRFIQLFEAHGVYRNQIPEFFEHDLSIADMQSDEVLIEKLTPQLLNDAADLFQINTEWLAHGQGGYFSTASFLQTAG